ncbi:MAG TPA: hypothetical protein PK961_08835 [bacterium]|nr:hypothetical protein [bacterium]
MKAYGSMILVVILVNSVFTLPCVCAAHENFAAGRAAETHDCCRNNEQKDDAAASSDPAPCNACGIAHRDSSTTCHGTNRPMAITEKPARTDTVLITFAGASSVLSTPNFPLPPAFAKIPANLHPSAFSCVMRC